MNKHHPLLGASLFTLVLAGGGCALIAGYDFDEYSLSDAGAGTTTSASSSSGGDGGAGGSSSSSSSSGSSSSGSSSSSSGSSSSGSSSSSSGSSSSSSGLTGGTVLLDNLLCPTTVTIGVAHLFHATGFASGLNSAGWVKLSDLTKGNVAFPVPVSEIPGVVGNSAGVYAVVNNTSNTPGNLFQVPPPALTPLGSVSNPIGGVALIGPNIFFTTRKVGANNGGLYQRSIGSTLPPQQVWTGTNPHGPVAANGTHVYWTQDNTIWRADAADPSKTLSWSGIPAGVRALAADDQRVWIGHDLGLHALGVDIGAAGEAVVTAGTPVHGIVAKGGGAYFTQGDTLYQVVSGVVTAKVSGFIAPRGVAQDGSNVYVADQGSCSSVSDGKIVKVLK